VLTAAAVVACGDTTRLPEAPATGALTAPPVRIDQTGNAAARINGSTVTFQLDDSGSLVVHVTVRSTAQNAQTLAIRASLFDSSDNIVGDATGGTVNVGPGVSLPVELTGPAPNGTIASARFELTTQAAPTPTSATPPAGLGTPGT